MCGQNCEAVWQKTHFQCYDFSLKIVNDLNLGRIFRLQQSALELHSFSSDSNINQKWFFKTWKNSSWNVYIWMSILFTKWEKLRVTRSEKLANVIFVICFAKNRFKFTFRVKKMVECKPNQNEIWIVSYIEIINLNEKYF